MKWVAEARLRAAALPILVPITAAAHEFQPGDLLIDYPGIVKTPPGAKVAAG